MRAAIALVICLSFVTTVAAGPRKVLVLPLDGNAPAAQRSGLNDTVAKLAKNGIAGDVTVGDTTFNETAAAVGCSPEEAACAESVRETLSVDELVYGTATTKDGSTTVVVKRVTKGQSPKSQSSVIGETDSGEQVEPGLAPMFPLAGGSAGDGGGAGDGSGAGAGAGSGSAVEPAPEGRSFFDTRERKLGVAFAAGGAAALIIGFSFWASKSGMQQDIDNHPTRTLADIQALMALEDRAASKAMWGNIMVVVGVGLGATGAYFLWKDHKNRGATVTPAPTDTGTGMTLVLGGQW